MRRPLFLHQLDDMTSRGCQTPHCPHDHGGELFLTGCNRAIPKPVIRRWEPGSPVASDGSHG